MQKLWMAIALGTLIFSCGSPVEEVQEVAKNSDWTAQNLKGMVQSIETNTYTPDSTGQISQPDSCCVELEQYDDKGYSTGFTRTTQAGVVSNESTMQRHAGGQMKDVVNSKDGKVQSTFKIEIDEAGKYISAKDFDSSGSLRTYYTDIKEDEYGAVTNGIQYNADSTLKSSFENIYNKGQQIGGIYKDSAGNVTYEYSSELNDKGDIIKTTSKETGKDSTTTKVETFTYDSYDEQGNWTQCTTNDENGKATKVRKRVITYYTKK